NGCERVGMERAGAGGTVLELWRKVPGTLRLPAFGFCRPIGRFGFAPSAPEILEAIGRELGVAHGVLNIAMAEPSLQRSGVVASIGQGIAASMPQHVREDLEWHSSTLAEAPE